MQDLLLTPQFLATFGIFAAAVGTITVLAVKERKPRQHLSPSLLPSTPVMLFAGIIAMLSLVHLINLLGIHTGR